MKNKDFIALKRAEILNKMNAAVAANDSEKFSEAFMELCQEIEQMQMYLHREAFDSLQAPKENIMKK